MKNEKEKIILWGSGAIANKVLKECLLLGNYDVLGVVDNNKEKCGKTIQGFKIYLPDRSLMKDADRIVILSDYYDEIADQIHNEFPEYYDKVDNKNFFYKEAIKARYRGTRDGEISELLRYIESHDLRVFNYDFSDKYIEFEKNVEIMYSREKQMFYVMRDGKQMFFSKKYNTKESVAEYYASVCEEQDTESPHRYLSSSFNVKEGDVVVDVGAAEGFFSLDIIEKASKIYIIEADPSWVEALQATFEPYAQKVKIIQAFLTSYDNGMFRTLDSIIDCEVNFIKMDIEGAEWDALIGAKNVLDNSKDIKLALCCYHSEFDQTLIENQLDIMGLSHDTTEGYMWFPYCVKQSYVSTRFTRAIVRGWK